MNPFKTDMSNPLISNIKWDFILLCRRIRRFGLHPALGFFLVLSAVLLPAFFFGGGGKAEILYANLFLRRALVSPSSVQQKPLRFHEESLFQAGLLLDSMGGKPARHNSLCHCLFDLP